MAEEKKERLWSSLRRGWWPLFAPSSSPSPSPQSAFFILAESFSKPRTRSRSTKHCRRLKKVFFFSSFFFFSFFSFLFFSFLFIIHASIKFKSEFTIYLCTASELMLLGFISLLLTVTQNGITKICVPPDFTRHMLPCSLDLAPHHESHFQTFYFPGTPRRLLAAAAGEHAPPHSETEAVTETGTETGFCARKVSH